MLEGIDIDAISVMQGVWIYLKEHPTDTIDAAGHLERNFKCFLSGRVDLVGVVDGQHFVGRSSAILKWNAAVTAALHPQNTTGAV
jgi:hypothetical protein